MYDEHRLFCVCAFMDRVFVFGGSLDGIASYSCLQFDTKEYSWKEFSAMKETRIRAACAVFEERIVVCGGYRILDLNSVES